MILVTKKDCQKCDWIKQKIDLHNINGIEIVDGESIDGMSILAYNELLEGKSFPFLIIDDDTRMDGTNVIGMWKHIQEVLL